MLPASLGPPSKESIKFTECLQWQIQSNRLFLTVMTKQRYRGKQLFFSFRNMRNERKNWSLQRQFISEEKFQKFTFMFPFFLPLFPFSFVFCQKQLGLTLQAVTSRPSSASYRGGAICCCMERHNSQTPNQHLHTWGVKTGGGCSIWTKVCVLRTNLLQLAEGGFPHYTWTIDMDRMLKVEKCNERIQEF